ncbi:DUF885 domain-containing protein [Synoicihabitans lomoniglobus]|uniref:DUF885 domain-containing protein n=1 Tax=Synoicihabitans lomoniglobus TaxID=2909285 RepID=A0AAF0CLY7_9BACT|nr:DUF885 domain-containing protein [Opitutaceae bacterium LMO-M01]WED63393.1 DUF885 domain-containing protein [Opitutaceae bacterium LMO-M01]
MRWVGLYARRPALLSFCLFCCAFATAAPDWVERSNAEAQDFVEVVGAFQPEALTMFGIEGFDTQVADLGPDAGNRFRAAVSKVRDDYQSRLNREENPFVREDLAILIASADDEIDQSLVQEQYLLPFTDAGRRIYSGVFGLLKPDAAPERRVLALERLNRYVGLAPNTTAITTLAQHRYTEAAATDPSRLAPFVDEVERMLANTPRFIAGIRQMFDAPDFDAAAVAPALDRMEEILTAYDAWVRETVLPQARTDYRLPAPVYAQALRGFGLDIPPETLIQRAQTSSAEIRQEMTALAVLIAEQNGWEDSNYRAVIARLKEEQLTADEVLPYYEDIIRQVEDIIRRERIVTLPDRAMSIRLGSEAENAAQPAPHMLPPPLTGGTGEERGTFVLTSGTPPAEGEESETFDDFTFAAGTWTLTAHEGRPGHELQFAAMVERGVSLARSFFAFNSVNVEGWALYAEAELKPYEPLEGQLIALQHRLLRASRAFLDPMLNLGLITRDEAARVLREDVGLSSAMVTQEVDRYTFRAPGQATSYFYGYQRLMALRTATEVTLGAKFDRMAFNDFIIGQGLLPPELLAAAVRNEFIPSQQ